MRAIEFLQNMLYAAKQNDMSIYENGDKPISNVINMWLDKNGRIAINNDELLLIDDYSQERFGKTSQEVYDILVEWNVLTEVNARPHQMAIILDWFKKKGVTICDRLEKYARMDRMFEFEGKTYYPFGNILGGFAMKTSWASTLFTIPYSSHKNFYKVAKKHKASCDVFYCYETDKFYIPCNNQLFNVNTEVFRTKYFKALSEYNRWYQ